jgi:hypothetical protein
MVDAATAQTRSQSECKYSPWNTRQVKNIEKANLYVSKKENRISGDFACDMLDAQVIRVPMR